jgi:hypothetical protein
MNIRYSREVNIKTDIEETTPDCGWNRDDLDGETG